MTRLETLKSRLVEAEVALHALSIGGQEASVDFGRGHKISYTQANVMALKRYIAELMNEIAMLEGRNVRGPIRFTF